ncbi:MAG: hypothetical protein ACK47E_08680, partial [Cyclobacteriaceae bacterium]
MCPAVGEVIRNLPVEVFSDQQGDKGGLDKDFVMPVKNNRKVALTLPDKNRGCYVGVESLSLEPGMRQQV